MLSDAMKTRRHLMQACLNARAHLGLPVVEVTGFANGDEEQKGENRVVAPSLAESQNDKLN